MEMAGEHVCVCILYVFECVCVRARMCVFLLYLCPCENQLLTFKVRIILSVFL